MSDDRILLKSEQAFETLTGRPLTQEDRETSWNVAEFLSDVAVSIPKRHIAVHVASMMENKPFRAALKEAYEKRRHFVAHTLLNGLHTGETLRIGYGYDFEPVTPRQASQRAVPWDHIGTEFWIAPNFAPRELRCRKTGNVYVEPALCAFAEYLRAFDDRPWLVTSAYRSPSHNASLRNASPTSYHLIGRAIDFKPEGHNIREAVSHALEWRLGEWRVVEVIENPDDGYVHFAIGRAEDDKLDRHKKRFPNGVIYAENQHPASTQNQAANGRGAAAAATGGTAVVVGQAAEQAGMLDGLMQTIGGWTGPAALVGCAFLVVWVLAPKWPQIRYYLWDRWRDVGDIKVDH